MIKSNRCTCTVYIGQIPEEMKKKKREGDMEGEQERERERESEPEAGRQSGCSLHNVI